MSRARRATVLTAAALVIVAALAFGPALLRERTPVASTATPPPLGGVSPIELEPGSEVCSNDIVLTPRSEVAEVVLDQPADVPSPSLEVRALGEGYASPPVRIEGGKRDRQPVTAAIEPPDRELFGRFCVRNAGDEPATLVGTEEFATQTRSHATVDGEPVEADLTLKFYEDRRVTVAGHVPELVDDMTIFRGFLGAEWFVWILLVLVVAGVPAGTLYALYRGVTGDRT